MIKQKESQSQNSQLISTIAEGLGEKPGTGAYIQIVKCVNVLGGKRTIELAQQALAIEKQGGMMTSDGTRRRTIGGVFFKLLKRQCTDEQFTRIFARERKRQPQRKQPVAAVQSKKPVVQVATARPQAKKKPTAVPAQSWRKRVSLQ
jgi:hypothetical protein